MQLFALPESGANGAALGVAGISNKGLRVFLYDRVARMWRDAGVNAPMRRILAVTGGKHRDTYRWLAVQGETGKILIIPFEESNVSAAAFEASGLSLGFRGRLVK